MASTSLSALERSLLANLLTSQDARLGVEGLVIGSDFADTRYGLVFDALMELASAGAAINPLVVHEELIRRGRGESISLDDLLSIIAEGQIDPLAAEGFAHSIKEASGKRRARELGEKLIRSAEDPTRSYEDTALEITQDLDKLSERHAPTSFMRLTEILPEVAREIEEGIKTGQPSGYPALDRVLRGGFKPGQLITLAAGTGLGKTAFALNCALNIGRMSVRQQKSMPVLFFSLEMKAPELINRLVQTEGQLLDGFNEAWQYSDADKIRAREAMSKLEQYPIFVVDRNTGTLSDIRRAVELFVNRHGTPGLVVVDYLQLLSAPAGFKGNRTEAVGAFSYGLKRIAMDMDVPVMALSQMSREYMKRPGHQPMTSDLRESGSIENDSDIILFVHRDSYFVEDRAERARIEAGPTDAKIIIAKQRSGGIGVVELSYIGKITAFMSKTDRDIPSDMVPDLSAFSPETDSPTADDEEWGPPAGADDEWA